MVSKHIISIIHEGADVWDTTSDKVGEMGKRWMSANRALPDIMQQKSEKLAAVVGDLATAKTKAEFLRKYKTAVEDKRLLGDSRLSRILQIQRIIELHVRHRSWGRHYRAGFLENTPFLEKNVVGRCAGVSNLLQGRLHQLTRTASLCRASSTMDWTCWTPLCLRFCLPKQIPCGRSSRR